MAALDRSAAGGHDPAMPSDRLAKVLKLAEELPEDERVELAREILRGLPDGVDELEDDLDRDELRRRIAAVQNGTATLIPWDEAREMVRRDG
jgi:putative addiction module component (TIGR02574 family)